MRRYGLLVLLAFLGIVLQMTLLPRLLGSWARPDLAFIVMIYLALHRPAGQATPAVLIIAYLTDLFSGLPDGTFLLVYLICFYVAGFLAKVLYHRGSVFPLAAVAGLSLFYVLLLGGLGMLGSGTSFADSGIRLGTTFAFAGMNLVAALGLFRLCSWIDKITIRTADGGRRRLSHVLPGDQ